jgi:hypothetical protein
MHVHDKQQRIDHGQRTMRVRMAIARQPSSTDRGRGSSLREGCVTLQV